jgi:hypothetical protein
MDSNAIAEMLKEYVGQTITTADGMVWRINVLPSGVVQLQANQVVSTEKGQGGTTKRYYLTVDEFVAQHGAELGWTSSTTGTTGITTGTTDGATTGQFTAQEQAQIDSLVALGIPLQEAQAMVQGGGSDASTTSPAQQAANLASTQAGTQQQQIQNQISQLTYEYNLATQNANIAYANGQWDNAKMEQDRAYQIKQQAAQLNTQQLELQRQVAQSDASFNQQQLAQQQYEYAQELQQSPINWIQAWQASRGQPFDVNGQSFQMPQVSQIAQPNFQLLATTPTWAQTPMDNWPAVTTPAWTQPTTPAQTTPAWTQPEGVAPLDYGFYQSQTYPSNVGASYEDAIAGAQQRIDEGAALRKAHPEWFMARPF